MREVHRYSVVEMLSEEGNRISYDPHGPEVVTADNFDKLEAEAQALREEVERGNRITVAMALDIAAVGEALGIPGEEQEGGTGEFIEAIQELQEELAALRARVVVPDGYALVPMIPTDDMLCSAMQYDAAQSPEEDPELAESLRIDWSLMLDAAPRLNGKAVSEGLLRRIAEDSAGYDQNHWEVVTELRALLGEGKEHE